MNKFSKAKKLTDESNVEYKGLIGSSLYFRVTSNEGHQVIYRVPSARWMCDCEWSALHKKPCSHILSCQYWLRKREEKSDKIKMAKDD